MTSDKCLIFDTYTSNYTYTQCFEEAAPIWTITHNLGKFPSVTVVDLDNVVVVGQVDYLNSNIIQLTFSKPFAGCAFLN